MVTHRPSEVKDRDPLASVKMVRNSYSGYEPSWAGDPAIHDTKKPEFSWLPRLHEVSIGPFEGQGHGR